MAKLLSLVVGVLLSFPAAASEDVVLPIDPAGQIADVPPPWGPLRLTIQYASPGAIGSIKVRGRKFNVQLAPCVTAHLRGVTSVEASGSWERSWQQMPPYVTLTFVQDRKAKPYGVGPSVAVTMSLEDGSVLMGAKSSRTWRGRTHFKVLSPATSCSAWRGVTLWPNNSSKPTPLRGAA